MLIEMFQRWRMLRKGVKWIDFHVNFYGAQSAHLQTKAGGVLALVVTLPQMSIGELKARFPDYADYLSAWPDEQNMIQNFSIDWFRPEYIPGRNPIECHEIYREIFAYWEQHHGI